MKDLKGIIAPVPTPFDENEELALDRLAENLSRWSRTRLHGFVLLGSTGEFVYLTTDEKKRVFEKARDTIPKDKLMLAGTGCESTRQTIALTKWAGELGVDYAMVINPFYYKRGYKPEILRAHYLDVAEASPVPIVLYNMPPFTGHNLNADLVIELASHPNIVGIKDSSGDVLQLQEICRSAPESFSALTGSGSLLLACFTVGASGGILAVANVAYDLCVDLYEAYKKGDIERARRLQNPLVPINNAVTAQFGIGGVKALLDRIGFYGGPPRRPLRRPPKEAQDELVQIHAECCTPEVSQK
jgi:4-hydroxy-2-oxoglutarate aldolase